MVITGQYSSDWSIGIFKWLSVFCGGLIYIWSDFIICSILKKKKASLGPFKGTYQVAYGYYNRFTGGVAWQKP